jgi:O-succinylbenzoate synthase
MWHQLRLAKLSFLEFPNVQPIYTAQGQISIAQKLILELHTENGTGIAEVPALAGKLFGSQTIDESISSIQDLLLPKIAKRAPRTPQDLDALLDAEIGCEPATSALSCAFWDLCLRQNQNDMNLFSHAESVLIPTTQFLTLEQLEANADAVFPRIKACSVTEARRAIEVAQSSNSKLLIIDFNRSIPHGEISALASIVGDSRVILEEPLNTTVLSDNSKLRNTFRCLYALDESLESAHSVGRAIDEAIAPCLVIKSAHIGSISKLLSLAVRARRAGIKIRLGGMFETGIGRTLNLKFAQELGIELPSDVSPPQRYLLDDVVVPEFQYAKPGYMQSLPTPGLSPAIDWNKFKQYCTRSISIPLGV